MGSRQVKFWARVERKDKCNFNVLKLNLEYMYFAMKVQFNFDIRNVWSSFYQTPSF